MISGFKHTLEGIKGTVRIKGGYADVVVNHTTASATVKTTGGKYVVLLGQKFAEVVADKGDTLKNKTTVQNIQTQIEANNNPILFVNKGTTQLAAGQYSYNTSVPIACTCPDWTWRGFACTQSTASIKGCKHMTAVHAAIKTAH